MNLIVIAFLLFAISGYERSHRNALLSESAGNLWLFLSFLDFIGLLTLLVSVSPWACEPHEEQAAHGQSHCCWWDGECTCVRVVGAGRVRFRPRKAWLYLLPASEEVAPFSLRKNRLMLLPSQLRSW